MNIQLQHWKIQSLNFKTLDHFNEENSFELDIRQVFPEKEPKKFIIIFDIQLNDSLFNFVFQAVFEFTTEENISEEFKSSDFPKINAPAIAFPYLRAYISNFTLQSGFTPIVLPSINFMKLADENHK